MKNQITQEILNQLPMLSSQELAEVKNAVRIVLCKYEVSEKTTQIQAIDDSYMWYLNLYCDNIIQSGKSKGTANNYRYHISRFLYYFNKPINEITEDDVYMYLGKYKKERDVSNKYLGNIRIVFNSFFNWCIKRHICKYNPVTPIDPIKYEQKIQKPYTPMEMERIRVACESERDISIVNMLYSSGIRVSELVKLNKSDIFLTDNEMVVFGKGSKERIVYFDERTVFHLKKYLESRTDDNEALFVTTKSPYSRLTAHGVQTLLSRIGQKANIRHVHPHRFRRTGATDLLNAGMPIEQVQELLGHKSITTTRLYCTVSRKSVKFNHSRLMNL